MKQLFLTIIIVFSFSISPVLLKAQDPLTITAQMFEKIKSIKTLQYSFDSKERCYGKIINEKSNFKIQIQPLKIYLYQTFPNNGIECLFIAGQNDNDVKINPNAFPWVNLNLNPEGSLVLENHHHSILDGGFVYTTSIIEYLLNKYKSQSTKIITNSGIVKIQGNECYHFTFTNPGYKLVKYTVIANETPLSIAKKFKINYYSILDNNTSIKGIGTIKPGTIITIPNDYASKMELYIHKEKLHPVYLKIYDPKGIYEEYTFINVVINPTFSDMDFSADNPKYNF